MFPYVSIMQEPRYLHYRYIALKMAENTLGLNSKLAKNKLGLKTNSENRDLGRTGNFGAYAG